MILASWAAPLLLAVIVMAIFGAPSLSAIRRDFDDRFGRCTNDIIRSGSTHVSGYYWKVWPAVFHANMTLQERGSPRRVWGLAFRSGPTRRYWEAIPFENWLVAQPLDDPPENFKDSFNFLRLPLAIEVRRMRTIRVYHLVAFWSPPAELGRTGN